MSLPSELANLMVISAMDIPKVQFPNKYELQNFFDIFYFVYQDKTMYPCQTKIN